MIDSCATLRAEAIRDGRRTPPTADTDDAVDRRVLEMIADV